MYTIEKITTLIGARRYGKADSSVSFVLTDSRSLSFPEETLFFAIKTQRNDGHKYIDDLYRRGVRSFVIETLPKSFDTIYPEANFLKVTNSLEALQRLAERHRDEQMAIQRLRNGSTSFFIVTFVSRGRHAHTTRR